MESFVRNFIRASLIWFGVGVAIGLSMALWPAAVVYRTAHLHANLLGFVSMMIFGVAYHVIPRFTGNPLYSRRLPVVHLVLANAGLLLFVGGWIARVTWPGIGAPLIGIGALASAAGAFLFIGNLWLTLERKPSAGPGVAPAAERPVFRIVSR